MKNQVYLRHSAQLKRYYIGFTTNLEMRLSFYENAEARKFSANATDWVVYFVIDCDTAKQGLSIEKHIK